jgi:hypothetical protein
MSRMIVEIANPLRHGETHTSLQRAKEYCERGLAYFLPDGKLKFRQSERRDSEVYIDQYQFNIRISKHVSGMKKIPGSPQYPHLVWERSYANRTT